MNEFFALLIGFALGVLVMSLATSAARSPESLRWPGSAARTGGGYQPIRRPGDRPPRPPQGGTGAVPKRAPRKRYQRPRDL